MYKNGDHREFRARRSSSGVLEGLTIFYSRRPQMALQLADANRRGDAHAQRIQNIRGDTNQPKIVRPGFCYFRHSQRRMPI